MAYSEHLADRVRQSLSLHNLTAEKKMMGGLISMVNDKMCVGIDQVKGTGQDRLMVRVGKASHKALVFKKESWEMDFTGKVMRGYLYVDPEGFERDEDLGFWVEKALAFNQVEMGKD
ncbi:MAG: RNA methyltransferase [Bacteroidetes bacterium]|nr:MAG: RNA methyltransferase [Bacteroidota bacterium]